MLTKNWAFFSAAYDSLVSGRLSEKPGDFLVAKSVAKISFCRFLEKNPEKHKKIMQPFFALFFLDLKHYALNPFFVGLFYNFSHLFIFGHF